MVGYRQGVIITTYREIVHAWLCCQYVSPNVMSTVTYKHCSLSSRPSLHTERPGTDAKHMAASLSEIFLLNLKDKVHSIHTHEHAHLPQCAVCMWREQQQQGVCVLMVM